MRLPIALFVIGLAVVWFPAKREDSIAAALAAWEAGYDGDFWPWGLQAIDYNGDGLDDLCVTAHNGGSIILENQGNGTWEWVGVGSALGGTFRPVVFDFNGDGLSDLLYRDSLPKTAFRNTGGQFADVNFAYGTGYDPVRYWGTGWFASDWGKWNWSGGTFVKQNWVNPNYSQLPPDVKAAIDANLGKQFFRAWFDESEKLIAVSGFWSYGKGPLYSRFLTPHRGKLGDMTAKLGLPATGAVCHFQDFNGDGWPDPFIVGHGYYLSGPAGYTKVAGSLTNFLAAKKDWCHQVFTTGNLVAVNNVRGQQTNLYTHTGNGAFALVADVSSWDGEPVAIADGKVYVGSGETVLEFGP